MQIGSAPTKFGLFKLSEIINIIGFDSAWSSKPNAKGGICAIQIKGQEKKLILDPENAGFERASEIIENIHRSSNRTIVMIDQPTIVPNEAGMRPVEKLAGAVVSFIGGGVQPSNKGKADMFGDNAAIWRFQSRHPFNLDPENVLNDRVDLSLIEVFPALALPSFNSAFFGRYRAPKYNPQNRRKFEIADWQAVCDTALFLCERMGVLGLDTILSILRASETPSKKNQDILDAILCALIGINWFCRGTVPTYMLADVNAGLIASPVSDSVKDRLLNSKHFSANLLKRLDDVRLHD